MCGIHGAIDLGSGQRPSPDEVRAMGRVARHRGPDDSGFFADGPLAFGMQRLSIIDVSGGQQPISNEDGTLTVVCNGEIYNFRELRAALEQRGHRFATNSDVEVIVHLYEEYGDDCISHLRGMFALALWDAPRQRLLIARDRLGIKPLYVAQQAQRLAFASEAKSLFELSGLTPQLNQAALPHYLNLGYVPAPLSMFAGVSKLEPGHLLVVQGASVSQRQYYKLGIAEETGKSSADWVEETRAALFRSVERQMVSDVPLGAFLSGGIDSSAVVAAMTAHSETPVRTFSIGFGSASGGSFYNELPWARKVADAFATQHREIVVEPEVASLMPRLLWHMDEPVADTAFVTTYLVSKFAREEVTVILSGVGGDELFGGYRRYLGGHYAGQLNRVPRLLRKGLLKPLLQALPADRHSRLANLTRYARALESAADLPLPAQYQAFVEAASMSEVASLLLEPPADAGDRVAQRFADFTGADPINQMMAVDLVTQLPDDLLALTDRMSMATSLECRVPLLDEELVDLAAGMPAAEKIAGRELKSVLKRALRGTLADEILYRQKRGFGAPMGAWFKRELKPLVDVMLSEQAVAARDWFDHGAIRELRAAHDSSREDNTDRITALLNLEIWARLYLDNRSVEDVSAEVDAAVAA